MSLKKPRSPADGITSPGEAADMGGWGKQYPTICEFLTSDKWDDGSLRALGTMVLFAEGSSWKCCLRDPAASRVAFVSGKTPTALLAAVERGLLTDELDWRPERKRK